MKNIKMLKRYIGIPYNINVFGILSHTSLYFKMFIASFLIFAVILLGISYQLEKHMRVTHIEVVKDELRSITAITAFHVNGDIVEQLQYPEQEESDEYDSIKKHSFE